VNDGKVARVGCVGAWPGCAHASDARGATRCTRQRRWALAGVTRHASRRLLHSLGAWPGCAHASDERGAGVRRATTAWQGDSAAEGACIERTAAIRSLPTTTLI